MSAVGDARKRLSESSDTQAEAVCAARRCTDVGYVKTEADGLLWCNRHALAYQRIYDPTPSAEPDGEEAFVESMLADRAQAGEARFQPCVGGGRTCALMPDAGAAAPAQDSAEVDALALALESTPLAWDFFPDPDQVTEDVARTILASDWLAQRDKDRDAAVAAKALDLDSDTTCDLADFIAEQRDAWPRRADDMDSQDLANDIADWLRARANAPTGDA